MLRRAACVTSFMIFSLAFVKAEGDYFKARKFDTPRRDVAVIVSDGGYYPENVVVFKGEKIRLYLTSAGKKEGCLNLAAKDFALSASPGEVAEGVIFFNEPGTYKFHCPVGKVDGRFTVLEKGVSTYTAGAEGEKKADSWQPKAR